ncbi:MAG: S8 family serine peptidase, partial [Alphaproteobacteria bacterium]|nr:S8 family serine peptidase [Alphaproteobacteria bacterium]
MANVFQPSDLNNAALRRCRAHPAMTELDGAGIVICVIDYGFDLLHPAFLTPRGETRFAVLIDQNGARLERARINELIRAARRKGHRGPLDDLYDPHTHYFGRDGVQVGAHGSWVASIAAGSRSVTFTGVAPKATLIGVQLGLPDRAWREEDGAGRPTWLTAARSGPNALSNWNGWGAYDDSPAISSALDDCFAFGRALHPDGIVFNLSIGAWAGGHDQSSAVNRTINA